VSVFPLVENPGAVFVPKARLFVVDEARVRARWSELGLEDLG